MLPIVFLLSIYQTHKRIKFQSPIFNRTDNFKPLIKISNITVEVNFNDYELTKFIIKKYTEAGMGGRLRP
ncbi:MAG: hypothetical protein LBH59_04080 [Planctomycetaceae bacterium]|jgi:hypothetical protein|nr:hypothetical protein [Planctomycetaceae bacterium]